MVSVYNKLGNKLLEVVGDEKVTVPLPRGRRIIVNGKRGHVTYSDPMITIYDIDKFPMEVLELIVAEYDVFIQQLEKQAKEQNKKQQEKSKRKTKIEEELAKKLDL